MRVLPFLLLFFLLLTTCKKSPTEHIIPPVDSLNTKEYIWSEDTLFNPDGFGMFPTGISGSSPQNVWISCLNDVWQGEIYHFNGTTYTRKSPTPQFNFDLTDIKCFDENTVYAVGYKYWYDPEMRISGVIFKYNGVGWDIVVEDNKISTSLSFIYGCNKNDIWVTGWGGVLWHFNGANWAKTIFKPERKHGPVISFEDGTAFITSEYDENIEDYTTKYYFTKYQNGIWKDIDSAITPISERGEVQYNKFGELSMWGTSPDNLYNSGGSVFHFDGNNWKYIFPANYVQDIKGTDWNDVYAVGFHGDISRFNGKQWYEINEYSKTIVDFLGVMPFKEEVFIAAAYQGNTYIVRGKVK